MARKTIIITNNENAYLLHLTIIMKKMGLAVYPTVSVSELMGVAKIRKPDLIMLDLNVSGIDGLGALKEIKSDPELAGVPVVIISADYSVEAKDACVAAGCDAYMLKPLGLRDIHGLLQKFIFMPMGYSRKHLRTNFNCMVGVSCNGETRELVSETLSEKGIYIMTDSPFPIGTRLAVHLPLYDKREISLQGKVVYVNTIPSEEGQLPQGMAIEFSEQDEDKMTIVSEYVRGLLSIPSCAYQMQYLEKKANSAEQS